MIKNKKLFIYKILFIILIIALIIIIGVILQKRNQDQKYEEENLEIVELFHSEEEAIVDDEQSEDAEKIQLQYQGYNVIGLIEIPAIDLEYPILEKTTQETMNISISRFYGGDINEYGNVSLAGHNNYSGTMFGKNHNLKLEDKVLLTDLTGRTIEYEIYDIFSTDPNDTSILETTEPDKREVTLITCKNGRSKRLIIKAREII